MATYHCTVKVGTKGAAAAHAAYVGREDQYARLDRADRRAVAGSDVAPAPVRPARLEVGARRHADYIQREGAHAAKGELEYREHGNMPVWAQAQPGAFWQASDHFERKNGSTYREIEVALPRELDRGQRIALVQAFVRDQIGAKHAYSFAIHNPRAAIAGGEQPHAHIMFSERVRDGIERDPERYFRRYNARHPERGGCRKDGWGGDAARLIALRERWAVFTNQALERAGAAARVDHRSLKAQGIDRAPEKHLGPVEARRSSNVVLLAEVRAAARARSEAEQVVGRIDIRTTLAQALRERAAGQPGLVEPAGRMKLGGMAAPTIRRPAELSARSAVPQRPVGVPASGGRLVVPGRSGGNTAEHPARPVDVRDARTVETGKPGRVEQDRER